MVDVWPIGNLTLHAEGKELAELYDMSNSGAIAFGDYNKPISNSNLLKIALLYAQNFDGLIMSFPQDANIAGSGFVHEGIQSTHLGLRSVPALAEELQIIRDLYILDYTGGRLHIPTISTEKSVKLIREAKKQGLQVTCSVAAHNLVLDDSCIDGFDADYKVNPPLRSKKDIKALIKGLEDGTIDIITSDHNPIDIENKKLEIQNAMYGTIGLESFFGSLNGILDLDLLIKAISSNPRKVFNRPEVKIALGEKACLSLFNPHKNHVFDAGCIRSKSKNAIFKNCKMNGLAYGIINKGTLVLV
jgi:dihydroorotase